VSGEGEGCEGVGAVGFAVFDHEVELFGVGEAAEGIFVEDIDIGEFAGFDGAEIFVESEVDGAVEGGGSEDVVWGHPALVEGIHLPVVAETL